MKKARDGSKNTVPYLCQRYGSYFNDYEKFPNLRHSYLIRIAVGWGSIATNITAPKYIGYMNYKEFIVGTVRYRILIIYF